MVNRVTLASYCVTDLVSLRGAVAAVKSSGGESLNVTPQQWVLFDEFANQHYKWLRGVAIGMKTYGIIPLIDGVPVMIVGADGELY